MCPVRFNTPARNECHLIALIRQLIHPLLVSKDILSSCSPTFHALQVQHETLLRVRKEGNAHEKYNSFRSAFEILETIGKPPADDIEKHYQRPVSLLAKVESLEQELARQKQESAQQMAAIDALVALLQEKGVIEKGAAGAAGLALRRSTV